MLVVPFLAEGGENQPLLSTILCQAPRLPHSPVDAALSLITDEMERSHALSEVTQPQPGWPELITRAT